LFQKYELTEGSENFSRKGAKTQRKPHPKRGSALRLCAFAGEILLRYWKDAVTKLPHFIETIASFVV
jgi:hypothetical protein